MVRQPAVAGMFYPGSRHRLEEELKNLIPSKQEKRKVMGLIAPHAGYIYSGACAGRGFAEVEVPEDIIILRTT